MRALAATNSGGTMARLGAIALLAGLGGCNEFKVPEPVNQAAQGVQQQVNQAVDGTKQLLAPPTGVELSLIPPVANSQCFAEWVPPGDGRPGVLILATYRDSAGGETFPSVYAQVKTDVAQPRELLGKVVAADLYVRRAADAPVLRSTREEPVQLKLVAFDGGQFTAEVVKGSVVSADTNEATPFLGKLSGRLE